MYTVNLLYCMDGGFVIIFENLLQIEIVSRTAVTKLRETRRRELSTLYSIQPNLLSKWKLSRRVLLRVFNRGKIESFH